MIRRHQLEALLIGPAAKVSSADGPANIDPISTDNVACRIVVADRILVQV